MTASSAQARAHPNIALVKYWGNVNDALRLPANPSISITLDGVSTLTRVCFDSTLSADQFFLNEQSRSGPALERVSNHLDLIRDLSGETRNATVRSENTFPAGAGIASSASAFAALTLAACKAADLMLDERALSRVARQGSGSAARSLYGGFVELHAGHNDEACYAEQLAPEHHWPLRDIIVIIDTTHKVTGSTSGHHSSWTSPFQAPRVADASRRASICREAIRTRDFKVLAEIAELDSNMMHAVMLTSTPPLLYWNPTTLSVMQTVSVLRQEGCEVFYTIDAGPNVHCITTQQDETTVQGALKTLTGVKDILRCGVGGSPTLL